MHVPTEEDIKAHRLRRLRGIGAIAVGLTLTLGLAACGDDDEDAATTTTEDASTEEPTTTEAPDGEASGETVDITGVDYAFEGVPEEPVAAGTELSFTNASEVEVHELLLLRIDDDETRPLEELLGLPEEEAGQVTEFQGVAVALPGEEGMVVEGDLVIDEPGTYAMLCFIPTGADPQAYQELLTNPPPEGEGPPDIPGGPPHFTQGMAAELTVE